MNVNLGKGLSPHAGLVRRILDEVADGVVDRTPFRRAILSLYENPLVPGLESPRAHVVEYACRGLSRKQERDVSAFVGAGAIVSGLRYNPSARREDSYYFPHGEGLPPVALLVPSLRSFIHPEGWNAEDVLLTPFWVDGRIIGQISVDDPRDGAPPTQDTLRQLDTLASVAAVALRDARDLEQLYETHRVFQFLTESAMTGVLVVRDDEIRYVNSRACEVLGYSKDELLSLNPWWQLVHPDDRPSAWAEGGRLPSLQGMTRAVRRDGRVAWLTSSVYALEHERGRGFVVHFYDVTDHVETESLLKEKALRDPLTGLMNRSYFEDAIRIELERSKRYKRPLTLMMGDLTRFKRINDRLGHQEGDRVLRELAGVVLRHLRDSDWVIRYGGDEFLFILPETSASIDRLEARLSEAILAWSAENIPDYPVGMDFGWATWTPDAPREIPELIRAADQMLYKKKEARTAAE
jgi:diguanylate cyclase (GGDEF)-like protein/PAS domain S-box-containing protein